MKKHLVALGMLPLCMATAFAQSPKTSFHKKRPHKLNQILSWQQSALPVTSAAKPTAIRERVIGIANYINREGFSALTDSTRFVYSANRGSAYSIGLFSGEYPANSIHYRTINSFEALYPMNGSGYVDYDSSFRYEPADADVSLAESCVQEFNSINKISLFKGTSDEGAEAIDNYVYDAQGRLVTYIADSDDEHWFFYDNDQQTFPSRDSSAANKGKHTLDDNNKPIYSEWFILNGSTWEKEGALWMNYNSSNGLLDTVRSIDNQDSIVIVFAYKDGNTLPAEITDYSWDLNTLYSKEVRYFNSGNQPDSITYYIPEAGEDVSLNLALYFVYNDKNNPVRKKMQISDSESNISEHEERYYYEEYDEGSSVTGVDKAKLQINCYPNPVENTLYLHIESNSAFIPASVNVVDMVGRTVKQIHIANSQNQIDLSALHSGIYYITVSDKQNQQSASKMIVKQ